MNFKKYHVSRNLFDINSVGNPPFVNTSGTPESNIGTLVGGVFTAKIGLYSRATYINYSTTLAQGTYTISFDAKETIVNSLALRVRVGKDNIFGEMISNIPSTYTRISRTFTLESESQIQIGIMPTGNAQQSTNLDLQFKDIMLNTGSQPLPYEPYSSEVWHDIPHYIHNTSTDTLTTPAVIYANDNNATVGLKGNMYQASGVSPTTPIQPSECGDLETTGEHTGQYKIPILNNSQTTNVYLGEVETTRRIKKLALTGNESSFIGIDDANHIFAIRGVFNSEPLIEKVGGFCTHYKYNNATSSLVANMQDGDFVLNRISGDYSFTIKNNTINTAANFKTYLQQQYAAGTPVTVWYVLATEETGIVNEPLRKIGTYADEVSGITTPVTAGANTLTVETTLQPSEITATYKGWHPVSAVHEKSANLLNEAVSSDADSTHINYNKSTPVQLSAGQAYTFSCNTACNGLYIKGTDDSNIAIANNASSLTYTPDTAVNVYFRIWNSNGVNNLEPMVNTGSAPLPYEPYWT